MLDTDALPITGRLIWDRAPYAIVLDAVRHAEQSVWIATANLKDLHVEGARGRYVSGLSWLERLAAKGVELRILHASLPSGPFRASFDERPSLVRGGLSLRQCPRVHLKTVIVDGRLAYVGSANWTGAGLGAKSEHRRNFEVGVVTEDDVALDAIQARYAAIWRGSPCRKCGQRRVCEAPLDVTA